MTAAKRVTLILVVLLGEVMLSCIAGLGEDLAKGLLQHLPGVLDYAPRLPETLGRAVWLAAEMLPLLVWKDWRKGVGSLRFSWSWAILLPAFPIVLNLTGFHGWPAGHPWTRTLDILLVTLLIGANEDLLFRGYAFLFRPQAHPRLVVLISSVAFAVMHYGNLSHDSLYGVNLQVGVAFFMGLALGIVRLATGSLGWCILLHGLVDGALDLNPGSNPFKVLVGLSLLFSWLLLIGLAFWRHPAMQPPLPLSTENEPPETRPVPGGLGPGGKLGAALVGLAGCLTAALAVVCPYFSKLDPQTTREVRAALAGAALPCFLTAIAIVLWRKPLVWRRVLPPPPDPGGAASGDQVVKLGAVTLAWVTLLITLMLGLTCINPEINGMIRNLFQHWKDGWVPRGLLGLVALVVLPPPCLLLFYLAAATGSPPGRGAAIGWTTSATYHALLTWFFLTHTDFRYGWFVVLKLPLWAVSGVGLTASLYLAIRPALPRRLDWMFPVAVAYPLALLAKDALTPLFGDWLWNRFPSDSFGQWSDELAAALTRTALLAVALWPLLTWKRLRNIGTLRLRWSWTVLLILPILGLNLVFLSLWPNEDPWPQTLCLLWSGLMIAAVEELIYRGYLFHAEPQTHPRFVVLASALFYALSNLASLQDQDTSLHNLLLPASLAFVFGLGLGIVRLVTGSLGWCLLVGALAGMANIYVDEARRSYQLSAWIVVAGILVAAVAVLWRHPRLWPGLEVPVVAESPTTD